VYRRLAAKSRNGDSQPSPERGYDRSDDEEKGVPANPFAEVHPGENDEDGERDAFLNDLQLISGELAVADPIGRHLEAVFAKRNQPTDHNGLKDGRRTVFQMPVPGHGHESV